MADQKINPKGLTPIILLKHPALTKEELLFRAVDVADRSPVDPLASEALINDVIERGASWVLSSGFDDFSGQLDTAVTTVTGDCAKIHESFLEELELRINTKRSQITTHFERQIQTQNRRLESMISSNRARPQDITGTRTRIRNLETRFEEELSVLDASAEVSPEFKRVACGIIKVTPLS